MRDQLIGRQEQLARAEAVLRAAGDGDAGGDASGGDTSPAGPAHLVFDGAPGAGKTALLRATARLAERQGYLVAMAQAHPAERAFALGVAGQLVAASAPTPRRDHAMVHPAPALDALDGPDEPDGPDGLAEVVARLAADRPLLLAIDDVHWADRESLDWLIRLGRRGPAVPVRVVATRSPGIGEPGPTGLAAWPGAEFGAEFAAVAIPDLGEEDIAALARETFAMAAGASFVRDCHRATNGNALLVTELLRAVAAPRGQGDGGQGDGGRGDGGGGDGGGGVGGGGGGGGGEATLPARVPLRITRWASSRMGRLSAAALRLARAIVIIGDRAELSVVAELAGLDADEAAAVAAALTGAGFLTTGDRPGFVHPIVRDAIDQSIAPGARRVAHAAAASILGEAGAPADVVARHLLATDPVGRRCAAETLRAAAATSPTGSAAAVGYLRRALREPVDSGLRAELLAELGHTELYTRAVPGRRTGPGTGLDAAVEHLTAAYDITWDAPLLARVVEDLAVAHYLDGAPGQALRRIDHALAGLTADHQDRADRLAALALAMAGPGDGAAPTDVDRPARLSVDRLRAAAAGEPGLAVVVAAFLAGLAAAAGRPDEALTQAGLVADAGPPSTPRRLLDCSAAAGVLCALDDLDRAAHCAAAMIAQAEEAGPAGFAALGHAVAARVAFHEGRLDDAIHEARLAGAVQFAVNGRAHAGARSWELGALLAKGDQNEAAAILTDAGLLGERRVPAPGRARGAAAVAAGAAVGAVGAETAGTAWAAGGAGSAGDDAPSDAVLDARFLGARGLLHELRGDLECALTDHLECGRLLTAAGVVNPALVPWRSRAALLAQRLGRRDAALRLASEELGPARRWGTPRAIGVALHALGVAAGGRKGLSLLEESVALLARSPARVEHAAALYDLGRTLGDAGRREEARPLLHESYRLAAGCGARPLADRCAAEIRRAGGRRPRAPLAGTAALTAQERRIAERAVAGATNREIAEEFLLTLRTVETHLTGVYRKLGIAGRAQLAAGLAD